MALVTAFSGDQVKLTLKYQKRGAAQKSVVVRGFAGVSDAIKFEEAQEQITTREGMDGFIFFANSGRKGGMMTIKLLPNSPDLPEIMTVAQEQKEEGAVYEWSADIILVDQNITAALTKGMLTHFPTFPTIGMANVDDLQFSYYFSVIDATWSESDFNTDTTASDE